MVFRILDGCLLFPLRFITSTDGYLLLNYSGIWE